MFYLYYCVVSSVYAIYIILILICRISVIHITYTVYARSSFSRLKTMHWLRHCSSWLLFPCRAAAHSCHSLTQPHHQCQSWPRHFSL